LADWPDWTGETAVVVGTGSSVKDVDLKVARGRAKVFVIKSEYKFAPWADALYGIDKGWWIANKGAPDFMGLKFSAAPTACRLFGLRQVRLRPRAEILTEQRGVIGCGLRTGGGHSGFQAVNLAVQFGANRILLVGFDMCGSRRLPHEAGVSKFDMQRVKEWRKWMDAAAPQFGVLGVEVVNCSPGSALKAYRTGRLEDELCRSRQGLSPSISITT
jgi:hypothetical protein